MHVDELIRAHECSQINILFSIILNSLLQLIAHISTSCTVLIQLAMQGFVHSYKLMLFSEYTAV